MYYIHTLFIVCTCSFVKFTGIEDLKSKFLMIIRDPQNVVALNCIRLFVFMK